MWKCEFEMELRSVEVIVGALNAAGGARDLVDIEELRRVERLTNENA